jgi:hypothetical protein
MSTRPSGLICLRCGAQTNGIVLCQGCQRTSQHALRNIASYHSELFSLPNLPTTERRARRVADPTGNAAGQDKAAPNAIEEAAAGTKVMLAGWVRQLVSDRPQLRYPESESVTDLANLLSEQMRTIALLDWAGDLSRQLMKFEFDLRKLVAANKGRWYAGVCGATLDPDADPEDENTEFCTRVLYADPGTSSVRCPACRMTWPVKERRRLLLEMARETETNVATIARAAIALLDNQPSQARVERRIQNWIDRGKLERRGHIDVDGKVRKTYRLGDVLDLLLDERATRPQKVGLDTVKVETYTSE